MTRLLRRRTSPAMVIAMVALFVSLGGVGYAAATIGSAQIRNNSVRSKDIRNNDVRGKDIRNNTLTGSDIRESRLGTVPNAASLGGQAADAFASSSNFKIVKTKLNLGQTATLATNGPVSLVAKCDQNGAQDRVQVLAATTQANSFMDGDDDHNGPGAPAGINTFLEPTTAEADRQLFTEQTTTAGQADVDNNIDDGWVASASGNYIGMQGETVTLALNAFGTKCAVLGTVFIGSH